MAAGKTRGSRKNPMEAIEVKIEKAKGRVIKTKEAYDTAVQELKDLMDKRDALRKDDLYDKFAQSNWTYERIVKLLESDPPEDE